MKPADRFTVEQHFALTLTGILTDGPRANERGSTGSAIIGSFNPLSLSWDSRRERARGRSLISVIGEAGVLLGSLAAGARLHRSGKRGRAGPSHLRLKALPLRSGPASLLLSSGRKAFWEKEF